MEEEKVYWDAKEPLKRLEEGETASASQALYDYAHMGYNRSLRALLEKYEGQEDPPTKSYMTLGHWSSSLDWQDRIARWEELERERDTKLWRERRDKLRDQEWKNAERLQEIITKILEDMPSFIKRKERVTEPGKCRVIQNGKVLHEGKIREKVLILEFDVNAAIKFVKTASDIGRRAAEMDKAKDNIMSEIDFSKLNPEQVSRIAEGEHILDVLNIRK